MHREAFISHVDFQQISRHAVADNPIWRQTTVLNARPDKNESQQRFELFGSRKTVNESSLELEPKRQRKFQLTSIVIKI